MSLHFILPHYVHFPILCFQRCIFGICHVKFVMCRSQTARLLRRDDPVLAIGGLVLNHFLRQSASAPTEPHLTLNSQGHIPHPSTRLRPATTLLGTQI